MSEKNEYSGRVSFKLQESDAIWGVPPETVRKWIKRPKGGPVPPLKAFRPGKDWVIMMKDMENYLKLFPNTAA